jgi:hypothetical protein
MQLIRTRLRTATCTLLAVAGTAAANGDWRIDAASLVYSEQGRVSVVEPFARLKRNFSNGQSFAAKIVLDAITGASPNGAMPTDHLQTFTSASGRSGKSGNSEQRRRTTVIGVGDTPIRKFQDHRGSLDLEYERPLARTLKAVVGGHLSAETDYVSRGATLTLSWDTADRLTTFTAGAGGNFDLVNPIGGKPEGFEWTDSTARYGNADKRVFDGMFGITRVLSRRWLMQLNYGRAGNFGYLTEPYKVVSVLDGNGSTTSYRFEKRPDRRTTQDVLLSSAYQLTEDVVHFSYSYYWDNWRIRSHTVDVKYRYELPRGHYLEPHARYYSQTAASFYTYGLAAGAPPPQYATSDYRFGKMMTTTFGLKYGLPISWGGEFNVRAEYMRQSGDHHPSQAVGVQKQYDLFPSINVSILQIGYTLDF